MKIGILGAGMVGRAIATDLAKNYDVTSFDISKHSLDLLQRKNSNIKIKQADLGEFYQYENWFTEFDIIVSAVPGFMGYNTLESIIRLGKNVVDISFFPENALDLDALAKQFNVTAIVDCGVAPGMSNLILGYYNSLMHIDEFECMVGGLPKIRIKPFEYKAPFSPIDVIEEYTRPARYVENSNIITKPALSDPELLNFDEAGTLESFNTDGLRSILYTMSHIPNMKEKTLRYPGHIQLITALKQAGFFNQQEIMVNGNKVKPMDFTAALLFDSWKLKEEDEEFTLMKIILKGSLNYEPTTIEYTLFDEYDKETQTSSMSRTTGYTCTAAVNMLVQKLFNEKGVFPPELIGNNKDCFEFIMKYLEERKVLYRKKVY
jgi:saccharopine dehydrogenase-like NADP-dependent oxidoreductase